MSPAFLFLFLAALVVFIFSMDRYQRRQDAPGFFLLLAGLWFLLGVFLLAPGILGFSYYAVTILLVICAIIAGQILPQKSEDRLNALLKPVHGTMKRVPTMPSASRIIERKARSVGAVKKDDHGKLVLLFAVFCVLVLYMGFFMSGVDPVTAGDKSGFQENADEKYKPFPYAWKMEYTHAPTGSYVVIITTRSIPLTRDILSNRVDAGKEEVEEYIEEEYGGDAEIEFLSDSEEDFNGHEGVRHRYHVEWRDGPLLLQGTMVIDAWYCHENLNAVAVAYFFPDSHETATMRLIDSIECH